MGTTELFSQEGAEARPVEEMRSGATVMDSRSVHCRNVKRAFLMEPRNCQMQSRDSVDISDNQIEIADFRLAAI